MNTNNIYVLTLSCPDKPGVVHAVSGFLAQREINILSSAQFFDVESGTFFMRVKVSAEQRKQSLQLVEQEWQAVADQWQMQSMWFDVQKKARVFIMVSKAGHCLNDLLYQASVGRLPIDIVGVGSNHRDLEKQVNHYEIPFFYWPVENQQDTQRATQEAKLRATLLDLNIDLIILARYMQILSPELCNHLQGKAINIHHSFLPSFKGAKPYYQAFDRGVKLIGATAHYVTSDLDEGPIIEQDVARVHHGMDVDTLTAIGNDIERRVLSRALLYHVEHRVIPNGHKTVVFL